MGLLGGVCVGESVVVVGWCGEVGWCGGGGCVFFFFFKQKTAYEILA